MARHLDISLLAGLGLPPDIRTPKWKIEKITDAYIIIFIFVFYYYTHKYKSDPPKGLLSIPLDIRNSPLKERSRSNKSKGWWIFHNQVPQWAKQPYINSEHYLLHLLTFPQNKISLKILQTIVKQQRCTEEKAIWTTIR